MPTASLFCLLVAGTGIGHETPRYARSGFATPYSIPVHMTQVMCLPFLQVNKRALIAALFCLLVAGTGIEPVSRGYEPRELPLLYPAILLFL